MSHRGKNIFSSKSVSPTVTIHLSGSLSQGHLRYLDQLVASAIDCALWPLLDLAPLGGVRPQRARISNGRGRSRFRYRCLPELYPRMDAARKGLLRRLILRRVARSGLWLPLLRTYMRERFRSTGRHPPRTGVELCMPSARVRHSATNP